MLTCASIFLFLATTPQIAPYEVVENKATLPLLNPTLADQQVEKLKLANGMEVYLVSDPQVQQSAAGLAVQAGSWQDPKEYPGLAHFLEHMLFMGTAAYPKEFEYMQFITDHGGSVNAYTASDRTVYMFSVNNDAFAQALNRFSHFFIDPLFLPNCINRELHAVDQEHSKNIEHDGWRQYMILKETGNPQHPNCSFSTGNAETLSGIPQEALKSWYHTYYGANKMHLVMISPLPIDELRQLAIQDFSPVKPVQAHPSSMPDELLSTQQQGHFIYIKPIRDIKQLSLLWQAPANAASDLLTQAPSLVAYALKQDHPKSLIRLLKQENLAEGLTVTCDRFSTDSLLFSIDISLTDKGLQNLLTVIQNTYQALASLKEDGIPHSLFQEVQTMAQLGYQYQARGDAFETVMQLTDDLVYEDLETFPQQTAIPTLYDANRIQEFLSSLDAKRCVYFVLADPAKTGVAPTTKEQWMDAEYAIKEIPPSLLTAWNATLPNADIQLPGVNPFIPQRLELVDNKDLPTTLLLMNDGTAEAYFAPDQRYQLPEVTTLFAFKSPAMTGTAGSQVLTDLYVRALAEQLSPTLSFAKRANLYTQVSSDDLSIRILVSGFSDKAPLLLQTLFDNLKQVKITKDQFQTYTTSLAADYDNASKELPVRQAHAALDNIILNQPTASDKLAYIEKLSYETFLQFVDELFVKAYTQAMFYGNLTQAEAQTLWQDLHETLGSKPYPLEEQTKRKILLLSEQQGPYMLMQHTQARGHGLVLMIEEGGYTFEKRAAQQILGAALSDAFFDTLRTKQQTAYIAKAFATEKERQLLQYFSVQSGTHHPLELLGRFELFLEDFNKNLSHIVSEERFNSLKANLITRLSMPPENMTGMAVQLYDLAFDYRDFHWLQQRIDHMHALSYKRFSALATEFLSRTNARRLAVLVEGVIPKQRDFRYAPISKEEIQSISSFVSYSESP